MRRRRTHRVVMIASLAWAGMLLAPALALVEAAPPPVATATSTPAGSKGQDAPPAAPKVAPDPARATATLRKIIEAYRDPRGVEVEVSVQTAAASAAGGQKAGPVSAKFLLSSGRRAIVSLRGFELRLAGGKITATHESSTLTYLQVSDNGSPYYSLFNAFQNLPFPELALALGEDDPSETCMQLMPQVPNVVPNRVEQEEVDGQTADVLVLMSDDGSEELRLSFDPETHLVERAVGTLNRGAEVEEGATLAWRVTSKARRPKQQPDDATFALDVTSRQKVDGLAALIDRTKEAEEDREVAGLKEGEPAPELALPKFGGGDWSLAAARTKPVVIDFWATWCGPCRAALPELAKLRRDFDGRAEVMLVNSGEQGSREEREARIRELFAPLAADGAKDKALACVLDLDSMAARRWLVRAFPTTFLVAPDGRIAGVWIGASPASQRELRKKLEELCAAAAAPAAPAEPAQGSDAKDGKSGAPKR